jgi:hypothetical protein
VRIQQIGDRQSHHAGLSGAQRKLRKTKQGRLDGTHWVNSGEVVMRTVETGGRVEYTSVGHVGNLASRMVPTEATGNRY